MPPDLRLDLDLPAPIRLADVPGCSRAWAQLPPFASYRQQHAALEADLALIYDSKRPLESFLRATEAMEYYFYATEVWKHHEDSQRDAVARDQVRLTFRIFDRQYGPSPSYTDVWRSTSVYAREGLFLRAVEAHAKHRGNRTYLLYGDELRMAKLCGGDGEGFIKLIEG